MLFAVKFKMPNRPELELPLPRVPQQGELVDYRNDIYKVTVVGTLLPWNSGGVVRYIVELEDV